MTFIYILGDGSSFNNSEIRYSIRSVVKYHPDARIVIVGEKPKWYTGEHHYIADEHDCPYVNQWKKLEFASTLSDEFIYMDDDFYLLEAFVKRFYTNMMLKSKYLAVFNLSGKWRDVVVSTYDALGDVPSYMLHAPLPIKSKQFLSIASSYKSRYQAPSYVPRQIYCHHSRAYKVISKKDLKIRGRFKPERLEGEPFFSIGERFDRQEHILDAMYPDASPYEISKRLEITEPKPEQTDINHEIES